VSDTPICAASPGARVPEDVSRLSPATDDEADQDTEPPNAVSLISPDESRPRSREPVTTSFTWGTGTGSEDGRDGGPWVSPGPCTGDTAGGGGRVRGRDAAASGFAFGCVKAEMTGSDEGVMTGVAL
jgi:hypothetical protein